MAALAHTVAMFVRAMMLGILLCLSICGQHVVAEDKPVCTVKGRVYTELKWYGYLVQKPFHQDWAKIQYQITYPVKECCTNLLIYYDDQIRELKEGMTCEEREQTLPANNNQIIPLYKNNRTVGCNVWNETGEPYYVCLGERIFRSSGPRTWYFAVSRCGSKTPLNLNYVFNISGFYGECEDDPLSKTSVPESAPGDRYMFVAIGLGVVAGVALILAAIFFALWLLGTRNRAANKGSSVTSSQATMTQDDVFYVNPSLSDQGQTDYSQSSSENYYEVIPERRSYESINAHLSVPHGHSHGHPHAHPHAHAHGGRHAQYVKDLRHPFPTQLMFEDYPPPPYQPPRGFPKHHTLHHPPHHHHPLIAAHPLHHTAHIRERPGPGGPGGAGPLMGGHGGAGHGGHEIQPLQTHSETSA